ncbi:hypothetical protein [Streptomyces aureus]|uniref:hypothetical protein n=1 Tax=Streptomyces aureus TaxID=193461 RepID=UPI00056D5FA7|nr:hypothetical protein [Streptomyces aureus]
MIDIQDLKKIEIQPGDAFVVQSDQGITAAEAQRLKDAWAKFFGDVPLFILSQAKLVQLRPVSTTDG